MVALPGSRSFGAEQATISNDPEIERTRQEIKMLDDLFKNVIVLVDATYVKNPSDVAAATAGKALFAAMKKGGWYDVRLLGLTDVIGDQDDVPRDAFEQTAAKKLVAGAPWYEEVLEKDRKRYLRVATGSQIRRSYSRQSGHRRRSQERAQLVVRRCHGRRALQSAAQKLPRQTRRRRKAKAHRSRRSRPQAHHYPQRNPPR
jgi:hypothetical protein